MEAPTPLVIERALLRSDEEKQDGRLAQACFSPNYKKFDQLLQTVKKETTVFNLVFKGFLQISIPIMISIFYTKEGVSRYSAENFFFHSVKKIRRENLRLFEEFHVSDNFMHKRGISRFSIENFRLTTGKIRRGTLQCSRKIPVSKKYYGQGGGVAIFRRINKVEKVGKGWDSNP